MGEIMKIFLLILSTLFFYGCQGNTVKGKHLVLKKTGDVTVINAQENKLHIYGAKGVEEGHYLGNSWFIAIPFQITTGHINAPDYSARMNLYLCKQKPLKKIWVPTAPVYSSKTILVLLSKNLLSSNNLLNDDGTIKGDICIEPNINNLAGTMKPEDHFEVTKEEMDRALEELYTVLGE